MSDIKKHKWYDDDIDSVIERKDGVLILGLNTANWGGVALNKQDAITIAKYFNLGLSNVMTRKEFSTLSKDDRLIKIGGGCFLIDDDDGSEIEDFSNTNYLCSETFDNVSWTNSKSDAFSRESCIDRARSFRDICNQVEDESNKSLDTFNYPECLNRIVDSGMKAAEAKILEFKRMDEHNEMMSRLSVPVDNYPDYLGFGGMVCSGGGGMAGLTMPTFCGSRKDYPNVRIE